jgi:hypothetical protein
MWTGVIRCQVSIAHHVNLFISPPLPVYLFAHSYHTFGLPPSRTYLRVEYLDGAFFVHSNVDISSDCSVLGIAAMIKLINYQCLYLY